MSSRSLNRSTRRTRSPSKIFPKTNSHEPPSSFSSPTLQRYNDPFKNSENLLFSTFGAGSVSAATPAAAAAASSPPLSPLVKVSENGSSCCADVSGDQHTGAGTPKTSLPAQQTLSSERSGARSALPDVLERIARRLSTLITTSPAHEPTTEAVPEKSPANPVEWASAPAVVEDATTPRGAGSRSGGGGGTTRSSTESCITIPLPCVRLPPKISTAPSPPAPPALQPRRAHQIHEPFEVHRPAIPWRLRHPTSPPHSRPSVAMAERSSTLVINEAKTKNRLSDSLRSPTDRTREHLISHRNFSSVLESAADCTSASSTPDLQEEEDVQHKRALDLFSATPHSGEFSPLIEWLLRRGERGDVGAPTASQKDGDEYTQASFFNEDYIMNLCAAATAVLGKEPALLDLEVVAHDTLVVVGDIHGQFQDLYTSVLCQQYDRRRCNPEGRDCRFLFMGDYVDRGPHSLEVVLLLLALKVEYPTLVYLTRGNHEEEKTSRVYGFLTEATSSLGAAAGTAVWSAVNKVFLDLPLAAIVQTLYMRFFVTHGGLSPGLQNVEVICALERHNYSCGNITAAEDDLIAGLLWSDPTNEVAMYKRNPRGCGFLFGPSASNRFCADNNFDFICRAHQVAMEGYMWTHNDRVLTVFSAPNYCGVNRNKGAVLLIKGYSRRPIVQQYDSAEKSEAAPARKTDFAFADMFA